MYIDKELLSIAAAENGYVVSIRGKQPKKGKSKKPEAIGVMPDPKIILAADLDAVLKCVKEKLPALEPMEDDEVYDTAFKEAAKTE